MEENHPSHSDYEVVPGTLYLVTQPSHNTNEHGDIILVPTPSDSLGDPLRLFGGLEYGAYVSWITVLGTTTASILGSSPYNMSNEALGLIWLSPLIGGLFGALMAGPFNDKLALFLTRQNRGWLEPEFRLWVFIPMAFLMSGGLLLYGVGAANSLPWIGPVVGMGLVGFGLTAATALTMTYVVDYYKEVDGEAITAVILLRNIIGYAMTFGIQRLD